MSPRTTGSGCVLRRALIVLLSTHLLAGCQSWRASSLSPHALLAEDRPGMIRLTLEDGRVETFSEPRMVSDTIVGTGGGGTQRAAAGEVRGVEVRRTSIPKTIALVVTHVTVLVTAVALIIEVQPHYRGF